MALTHFNHWLIKRSFKKLKKAVEASQLIKIADQFRKQQIFERLLFFVHYSQKRTAQYEKYIKIREKANKIKLIEKVFNRLKSLLKRRVEARIFQMNLQLFQAVTLKRIAKAWVFRSLCLNQQMKKAERLVNQRVLSKTF